MYSMRPFNLVYAMRRPFKVAIKYRNALTEYILPRINVYLAKAHPESYRLVIS
jgi:hypothetical protein